MLRVEFKNPMAGQLQLVYASYMMLSSCFKKTRCLSKRVEKKLYLHYQDLTSRKQEQLEEKVLRSLENYLLPNINIPNISEKEALATFLPSDNGYIICFRGRDFRVNIAVANENGKIKYTIIRDIGDKCKKTRARSKEKMASAE